MVPDASHAVFQFCDDPMICAQQIMTEKSSGGVLNEINEGLNNFLGTKYIISCEG
jgi:hypothetical protein